MKHVTIKAEGEFNLSYNPESKEFKDAYADYLDVIDKGADVESFLKNVCSQLMRGGANRMIEGVGYVKCNGRIMGQPYSGIEVESDDPDFDFEIS